jgi:hypothetical protein
VDVCFWHLADINVRAEHVRFRGQSGHSQIAIQCPLMTLSGHKEDDPPRASHPARSFVAENWQPLPLRVLAEAEAKEQSLLLSTS